MGYRDLPPWMRAWVIAAFILLACIVGLFLAFGLTASHPEDDFDPAASRRRTAAAHALSPTEVPDRAGDANWHR